MRSSPIKKGKTKRVNHRGASRRNFGRRKPTGAPRQSGYLWPPDRRLHSCAKAFALLSSEIDTVRDQFAIISRVAECEFRRLGAFEIQMQVVIPGETDAAVKLGTLGRAPPIGVGGGGLGDGGGDRRVGDIVTHGPRGIVTRGLGA